MTRNAITIGFVMLGLAASARADLAASLEAFAAYELGQPRKVLHEARLAAMAGTDQAAVRAAHEQQLLGFVQSGASVAARREACLWLGSIGSAKSLPVLEKLSRDEAVADVAAIAARDIGGEKPVAAEAAGHALAKFRAELAAAAKPAALLIGAIEGGGDDVARLAFGLVAQGTGAGEVAAWLGTSIQKLPSERQVLALNMVPGIDAAVIGRLAREGVPELRAAAVAMLGGEKEGAALLTELLVSGDAELAAAAQAALVRVDAGVVRPLLVDGLAAADAGTRAKMIAIAVARGEESAAGGLWKIAGSDADPNQAAAIRGLGVVAPVGDFERMLAAFVASFGKPQQADYQVAVFELARRQADYDVAMRTIEAAAATALPEAAKALAGVAGKLGKLKPLRTLDQVRNPTPGTGGDPKVLPPGAYSEITPKRFAVAAYLDCGPQGSVQQNGVTIECLNGQPWNSNPGIDPALSVHFAGTSLDYAVGGLKAGTDYILGLTWWDTDLRGRRQSIAINGEEVLPDTRPVAYRGQPTPVRIQFALPPESIKDGRIGLAIRNLEGPNAVTSELWIMERRQARAAKQVLLVSGQDYPGHDWRQTGPLMAEILAADERIEVTICETPYAVGLKHLGCYDAVFVHFKNYEAELPSTEAARNGLKEFVINGGGMCMSHFACGAFQEWPEFVNLAGRVWDGTGHDKRGPFTVRVVDRAHPVTRGLEDFQTDDELYFCLQGTPEIHLLCDAHSKVKDADHPQAFVFQPGKGRVFLSTLGHDVKAFDAAAVKQLYRQGAAWAAGL